MHVSRETAEQTCERLSRVLAEATFRVYDGAYAYTEYPVGRFPADRVDGALAFVRDEHVWSVLGPARGEEPELIGVFAFHFPSETDNSGFVGWLASHMKAVLGTGLLVVCGHNVVRGGIFDYWGVPFALLADAVEEVRRMRGETLIADLR